MVEETEAVKLARAALANAEKMRKRQEAEAKGLVTLEIDGEFVATMSLEHAETLKAALSTERLS